jgi:hypothetical protein
LAARVCADHFENVIIIDSEEWLASEEGVSAVCDDKGNMYPRTGQHRRSRVAQYGSFHGERNSTKFDEIADSRSALGYLVLLTNALRALFPEFDGEMAKRNVMYVRCSFPSRQRPFMLLVIQISTRQPQHLSPLR